MVREAEDNAEADKKRKEEADLVNEANSMIFQTKKSLSELKNVDANEKAEAERLCDELQKALDAHDMSLIKSKKEELEKVAQGIAMKAYQQAQAEQQNHGNDAKGGNKKDGSVDADFSDVQ